MIQNWIKIALRNFHKNLRFTLINIFGLTFGVVGIILVTLYWNDELNFNQWNPHKNEIYAVAHQFDVSGKKVYFSTATIPEGPTIKENFPEVSDYMVCAWLSNGIVKTDKNSVFLENYLPVSANFFEFFPFPFIYGEPANSLSDLQSIVISEDWMNSLYNGTNPLGKKLTLNGNEYTVKGVYRNPANSTVSPSAVIPVDWNQQLKDSGTNWATYQIGLYLKLRKGTDAKSLENKIYQQTIVKNAIEPFAKQKNISVQQYKENFGDAQLALDQLSTIRLFGRAPGSGGGEKGNTTMLYILSGLSLVILVLSSFNYINLTTASSIKRAKEVGVRKTLGATKFTLIVQFAFESFLICLVSLLLALTLSEIILPYFNAYFDKDLEIKGLGLSRDIFILLLIVTFLSGLIPAMYMANFQPLSVLKGNFLRSKKGIWIRNLMLGLQLIVSMFFMISGIIIYLQVGYMTKKDLGFKGDQVIAVGFSNMDTNQKYPIIKQEFKKIKGVVDVSSGFQTPARFNYVGGSIESSKTGVKLDLGLSGAMDYNFLDLLDIEIVEGRGLTETYASDSISNALINETLAKRLQLKNPIGEEIYFGSAEKNFKVVGVVKDYFVGGFQSEIDPILFHHFDAVPWTKRQMNYILFKLDKDDMKSALDQIEKKWKTEVEPEGYPFSYHFIDQDFAKTYEQYKKQQNLIGVMTIVVVVIALLGLFGVITLVIEQRMKEISIRKTLGATGRNLFQLISKEYFIITFIAFLGCTPIAIYLLKKWLDEFVYRINLPIWPFVVTFIFMISLVGLVIGICTLYAKQINPIKYLKYE